VIFQFRALAALAGRSALGGPREIVLATLMAARLGRDSLSSSEALNAMRRSRASAAKSWYGALTLPQPVRAAVMRVVQATETGNIGEVRAALEELLTHVSSLCYGASRAELKRLLISLGAAA
jgi:hypothetical protein